MREVNVKWRSPGLALFSAGNNNIAPFVVFDIIFYVDYPINCKYSIIYKRIIHFYNNNSLYSVLD